MPNTPVSLLDRLCHRPDDVSWRRWFELYVPLLRTWLARYTLQPNDADDVIQEVLVAVVRDLPSFRHNQRQGAFRRWLRVTMLHRLQAVWAERHQGQTADANALAALHELADPNSPLSRLWDREHDEHVTRRLLKLVEAEFEAVTWQAFRRRVLDGVATAAVAEELGISKNAVCVAKSRVLARLREESAGLLD